MDAPTQHIPQQGLPAQTPQTPEPPAKAKRRGFRDPLSIVLIVVIVFALGLAGLLGAELYARHRANSVVATVVECVVQDKADVSFGARPVLLQVATDEYSDISIKTAGNQVKEAKGMRVDLNIRDIKLQDNGDSKGTIGSLDATINWSSDGIKQTVQSAIPLLGGMVSTVTTNPSDGTILLEGTLGSVTAKPEVVDNGLTLQVLSVTGPFGITVPRETVQGFLDPFTSALTKNYPLGIHADSVQVASDGVTAKFSTRNATIPAGNDDPCFAGL